MNYSYSGSFVVILTYKLDLVGFQPICTPLTTNTVVFIKYRLDD